MWMCVFVCLVSARAPSRKCAMCIDVSYHGKRHAVNLMFVFGLVLSERTVPKQERGRDGERKGEWVIAEKKEGGVR